MAKAKKFLVLDLGMQSLRLAEFSGTADGKLTLLRGAKRNLILDPSLEATRADQIRESLEEILKEWKIKSGVLALVLPAHTVFTKVSPVEVPGGDNSQIDALIKFEAQHNIPFPLDEVVWDHVTIGQTPAGAVNVVYIAIKNDLLEELCKSISTTGLQIVSITASPLALYDAFRLSYPEEALSSTTLLLDIGSRTSNLIISSPTFFFSRSIPTGGLAVTNAIAKDTMIELDAAEELKVTHGKVALGPGFAPPEDPVEANLARLSRQTLLKTQADISRSISYYRTNLGGSDPSHILLTGGMANMPYLAEFLSEKLLKETLFFEPNRVIGISNNAVSFVEANANNLGELIGGALPLAKVEHTEVNLLPSSVSSKLEFKKRLPWMLAAVLIFLLSLASWYGYAEYAATMTQAETIKINMAIQEETSVSSSIDKRRAQLDAVDQTAAQLLSLVQFRDAYPSILADLSAKVPPRYLWMTEIQPIVSPPDKSQGKNASPTIKSISVKGLYLSNPRQAAVIDNFVTSLQSSTIFLVEERQKSKVITERSSPNDQYWAFPFALVIPLRHPIPTLP